MIDNLIRTIRFFLKLVIIIIIMGAVGFGAWLSVSNVRQGELAVLEDYRNARVISIHGEGRHYIWQACIPVVYKVSILPVSRVLSWDVIIPITGLADSEKSRFRIIVPVTFSYTLIPEKISDYQILLSGGSKLESEIKKSLEGFIARQINEMLEPRYQRNALLAGVNSAVKDAAEKFDADYKKQGVTIDKFSLSGPVVLPSDDEYARAVRELAELARVKFENEKSFLLVNQKIREDRLLNSELYAKLREMSKIIKDNPDILKYIYIDKMSDNVKIIISSDKTGLPQSLDSELRESGPVQSKKKEIDNLR